jgi:hypothetical protein
MAVGASGFYGLARRRNGQRWEVRGFRPFFHRGKWRCHGIYPRKMMILIGGLEHELYFSHHIGNNFPIILGIIIPTDSTDSYFSEGLKPPTSDFMVIQWELKGFPMFFFQD